MLPASTWQVLRKALHCAALTTCLQANHVLDSRARTIQTPSHLTLFSSHPTSNFPSPGSGQLILNSNGTSPSPFASASKDDRLAYKKGDEVTFAYGPHDSGTLLAEYGFILPEEENLYDHYDVTEEVERLFRDECSPEDAQEKKEELEINGYWGCVRSLRLVGALIGR